MKFIIHSYEEIFERSPRYKKKISEYANLQPETAYLEIDYWNDYNFRTQFYLRYYDNSNNLNDIGFIKIGFRGQKEHQSTYNHIPKKFEQLSDNFFSIGDRPEFYQAIYKLGRVGKEILLALNDIVLESSIFNNNKDEYVLTQSLLRGISATTVKEQFSRVLNGGEILTNYDFTFINKFHNEITYKMDFHVKVDSLPSTNVHAVIGKNGVGKSELFRNMIDTLVIKDSRGEFQDYYFSTSSPKFEYFSKILHVSFSPFDNYNPPKENNDSLIGIPYNHIGFRSIENLYDYTLDILKESTVTIKHPLWKIVIDNIKDEHLNRSLKLFLRLIKIHGHECFWEYAYESIVISALQKLSSGHFILVLMFSALITKLEEKTLVLLDEPELHLHPPLLMNFIQITSELLKYKNAIAIISTHSPIVLQEIPRSCVWKMYRTGNVTRVERPEIETYGENINTLTRDVFRLELEDSGFYKDLKNYLYANELTAEQVISKYKGQIGFEGKAYLNILEHHKNEKDKRSRE